MKLRASKPFIPVYETNDIDAFIPEVWANESVAILIENMVVANLVHTDFKNEIQEFGDVVNTRKPASFTAKRKTDADNVTIQNATATNIPVKLDQHWHTTFLIRDGQESKAFKDLVTEFLEPAVVSIAQAIDKILLGQYAIFMRAGNLAGGLGELSTTNGKDMILDARKIMNDNKAPMAGRNMILTSQSETQILKDDTFTDADRVGDDGTALREASIGRKLGFNFFMCQNMADVVNTDIGTADAINAGNLIAGSTVLTLDDESVCTIGDVVTVVGDMTPQLVTGINATNSTITVTPGIRDAILDNAVVTVYDGALVNLGAGYAAGYTKGIILSDIGTTNYPTVGQSVAIATSSVGTITASDVYTIVDVTDASTGVATIWLDRSLDTAIVDNAVVGLMPTGAYNLCFVRNAISLVTRPLAVPIAGTGALSAVANYGGLSIRVTITYDGDKQGHLVTVDLLSGVKVLDNPLGAVLLG